MSMETGTAGRVAAAVAASDSGVSDSVGESHEKCLGETADLGSEDGLRAFVPENHIRAGHFFLNRKLGGEDGLDQVIIESAARLEPLDLSGAGRSDDEHLGLAEVESLLKEERNVCDEQFRAPCSSLFQGIKTFLPHPRMQDRLQREPGRFIREHPVAQKLPVDPSLRIERLARRRLLGHDAPPLRDRTRASGAPPRRNRKSRPTAATRRASGRPWISRRRFHLSVPSLSWMESWEFREDQSYRIELFQYEAEGLSQTDGDGHTRHDPSQRGPEQQPLTFLTVDRTCRPEPGHFQRAKIHSVNLKVATLRIPRELQPRPECSFRIMSV